MGRAFQFCTAVLVFSLSAALPASAQDIPKLEVFGGYSFLHAQGRQNLNGWNASVTTNLSSWLGLTTDFSGHYHSQTETLTLPLPMPSPVRVTFNESFHQFLFGPRLRWRVREHYRPFTHALFGLSRESFRSEVFGFPNPLPPLIDTDGGFAMALGGGFDVPINDWFALRPLQADYLLFRIRGFNRSNFRYSGGVVVRFGRRR